MKRQKLSLRGLAIWTVGALMGSGLLFAGTASAAEGSDTRSVQTALVVIKKLPVKAERRQGYNRSLFKHWVDADGDGCDTRQEVLIRQSLRRVSRGPGCRVTSGRWVSAFDGARTTNPSTFDIDHLVPLAEAWDSGAHSWDAATRQAFANDLGFEGSLIAVSASSNRSKSDQDPAEWLPPRTQYRCTYVTSWIAVKHRWSLAIDKRERDALRRSAKACGNPRIMLPPKAKVVTGSGGGSGGGSNTTQPQPPSGNFVNYTVRPGAFCSERGSFGRTSAGTLMQCKTSATDSRYRWRAA